MVQTIVAANPETKRIVADDGSAILNVAECFSRTIQGENFAGVPATFLRLQKCTLDCVWCDTAEVWRKGNPYSVTEIVNLFEEKGVLDDLKNGHHLIFTGGSPMKQQDALLELVQEIRARIGFTPFIEIENECTLMPNAAFAQVISLWNNSPKLENSGMRKSIRHKPQVLKYLASLPNAFFKFVVTCEEEWEEILHDFIEPYDIHKQQIVLMPEGQTREQLQSHYDFVVNLCCREGLRMTDRMHVSLWDRKTGV